MTRKQEDINAAARLIRTDIVSLGGRDLDIYFWQTGNNDFVKMSTLYNSQADAENVFSYLGIQNASGILDVTPYTEEFLNIVFEFEQLGIIRSSKTVSSPFTASNGLVDLTVGYSDIRNAGVAGTTIAPIENSKLITKDDDTEAAIFLDVNYKNFDLALQGHVVRHELAHAMGLRHPKEVGLVRTIYDSWKYSALSYIEHPGMSSDTVPGSLMLLDYLALDIMGLLSKSYHSGINTYRIPSDGNAFLYTVYDGDGIDTITASGSMQTGIIDLRDGHFSSLGIGGTSGGTPVENYAIAYNTIIENAISGDKDDVIIGNSTSNELKGGKGDDFIYGNGENYKTDNWKFSDAHKNAYTATVDTEYTPGHTNDKDTIYGGEGNDYIAGESGDDTLYGDEDHDFIFGGMGDDKIEGGEGSDHLYGGDGTFAVVDGVDILNGGDGNDILEGGTGIDKYIFSGNFGRDMIKDNDGKIYFGADETTGVQLTQLTQTTKDSIIYRDAANIYQAIKIIEGTKTSLIISSVANPANSVTIKDWVNGNVNINLTPAAAPVINATGNALMTGNASDNVL
ncbi:MAG: M10 family metallopeptidase C-terminal domain-containing protein, partial [Pseudomonadota bacterium]